MHRTSHLLAAAALALGVAAGLTGAAHADPERRASQTQAARFARASGTEWARLAPGQLRTIADLFGPAVISVPLPRLRVLIWAAAQSGGWTGGSGGWDSLSSAQYDTVVEVLGTDVARMSLGRVRAVVAAATSPDARR
jgi:hypothetical protein